ncbi:MAG: NAD-dependent epimerase/dehydratase family protein [Candidatus Adlerbacteria bacterium]|nr:NAD-dependent epimerase/dehydratase family protein [Candidatus Adlerbacteria bacterium]MDZ4226111.1 NAD-dependent epimerase/dehydratase family protein [Patescibacteria group bacterium]
MTTPQTIVVTGGAGFIGSHLCEVLAKAGHKVISLDNYFTGSRDNHVEGVEYRQGHTKDIAKHIRETPDIIYHLGEYSRVAKSLEEPELVWDLNMDGTFGVLEFWRKKKCKLVYAGSSTKFESRDNAPYTWGKAANAELVANYSRWYDLPYSTVYFYNVYGPGERSGVAQYGTVIETFKQNYLQDSPHEIRGTGEQTRAFTHVADTIEGMLLVGERGERDEYAICANDAHSLVEVAKLFSGEVVHLPPTKTTRSSGVMDTAKIEALGWKQKHWLKDYIEEAKKEKK